jgi:hypothetical protein
MALPSIFSDKSIQNSTMPFLQEILFYVEMVISFIVSVLLVLALAVNGKFLNTLQLYHS